MMANVVVELVAGVAMAATPVIWVWRNRGGRRRRHTEGRADGFLLLFSLFVSLGALVMAAASVSRLRAEARDAAASRPVTVRIERCTIQSRTSGMGIWSAPSHELTCDVRLPLAQREVGRQVSAGFPSSDAAVRQWIAYHPPGSPLVLRQAISDPAVLSGFELVVPSTTTAAAGARTSVTFGMVGALLFLSARFIVAHRVKRLGTAGV